MKLSPSPASWPAHGAALISTSIAHSQTPCSLRCETTDMGASAQGGVSAYFPGFVQGFVSWPDYGQHCRVLFRVSIRPLSGVHPHQFVYVQPEIRPDFHKWQGLVEIQGHTRSSIWIKYKSRMQIHLFLLTYLLTYYFSNRVADIWNCLPSCVVSAPSLNSFKHNIKSFDFNKFLTVEV